MLREEATVDLTVLLLEAAEASQVAEEAVLVVSGVVLAEEAVRVEVGNLRYAAHS